MTTNYSLEGLVRPYGTLPFSWSNVFEVGSSLKTSNAALNIAHLVVKAKTSVRTTTIKGASWRIKIKSNSEFFEVSRNEVQLTITDPDNSDNKLTTAVPASIQIRDTGTGATTTTHYATPNSDGSSTPPGLPAQSNSSGLTTDVSGVITDAQGNNVTPPANDLPVPADQRVLVYASTGAPVYPTVF